MDTIAAMLAHRRTGKFEPNQLLFIVLIMQLLAGTVIAQVDNEPVRMVEFQIKDQFDRLHTSGSYRNCVVLLVTGDRKGSEYIEQWAPALQDSLAGLVNSYRVKFLPVAHLKGVPFFIKGTVKSKFPKEKTNWTLMDYKGLFRKSYDLPNDMCSLVVFDRQGWRRLQVSVTDFDPDRQARILTLVRDLASR